MSSTQSAGPGAQVAAEGAAQHPAPDRVAPGSLRSGSARLRGLLQGAFTWGIRSLRWGNLLEWSALLLLSLWVGRVFANLDPTVWPLGGDYPLTIQPHYIWPHLSRCGACVLWNGLINGGYPSFAEAHAGLLHPLVVLPTLIWGVVNGSKVTLILSFFMAGIAQWWLARVMGLGRVARLWTAGMAILGGHLFGRMEMGLVGMVLSTAAGALIFAPALQLGETGRRRAAVLLGIATALALLSGQGYIQVGIVPVLTTAALVFGLDQRLRPNPVWREYLLAGGIALLAAGIFLVPMLHYLPQASKHVDTGLAAGQPLAYVPLNLVIRDFDLYRNELLSKIAFPAMYINYIGWLPLMLALIPLRAAGRARLPRLLFLAASTLLIFFVSSSTFVGAAGKLLPETLVNFRFPSLVAGLAITPLLALAGWGVDELLKLDWPQLSFEVGPTVSIRLRLLAPVVVLVLAWSLKSPYDFGKGILKVTSPPPEAAEMVSILQSEQARWVAPQVSHFWMPPLLEAGLKLTQIFRPVNWKDRQPPPAEIEYAGTLDQVSASDSMVSVGQLAFILRPENHYAYVETRGQRLPCTASSMLGDIQVDCRAETAGTLVVQENSWSGWRGSLDGRRVDLLGGPWLQVEAPAGAHHFEFRYRPWDVALGALLTLAGMALGVWAWTASLGARRPDRI